MNAPSNKALAVLAILQEVGGEHDLNAIAEMVRERTPCGACGGTGECPHDDHCANCRGRCRRCYGRGRVPFYYSDSYTVLRQLVTRGLAERRHLLNEWGDETRGFVYRALPQNGEADDELERIYAAPSWAVNSQARSDA